MARRVESHDGKIYRIPEILNWEDYRYEPRLTCSCGRVSVLEGKTWLSIVGVCNTPHGLMACYECKECGDRMRWHVDEVGYDEGDLQDIVLDHPEWICE